jgi:hypothetical protein
MLWCIRATLIQQGNALAQRNVLAQRNGYPATTSRSESFLG